MQPGGYYYEAYSFCAAEHGGTHLDAPIHFAAHRWTADAIPLDRMIGAAIVVDATRNAAGSRLPRLGRPTSAPGRASTGRSPTARSCC
jgi:kynurenine formamidase